MEWNARPISKKSHIFEHQFEKSGDSQLYLLISDLHWDNPHCQRDLLELTLKEAVKRNAKILVNGDFYCAMQGKGDPRGNKSSIRDEHWSAFYLDRLVETAVEWFEPYKNHLVWIGQGNHESGVIKHKETDLLRRFADLYNLTHQPEHRVHVGGYRNWITLQFKKTARHRATSRVIHAFHGSGGGGEVSNGMIRHQRQDAKIEGADVIWMGHFHELYHKVTTKDDINQFGVPMVRNVHHIQTSTFKEEYNVKDGEGFHIERDAPPKPLGGYWMEVGISYDSIKKQYFTELEFKQTRTRL